MKKPIVIDEKLKKDFQVECVKLGKQMSEIAEMLIKEWLKQKREVK